MTNNNYLAHYGVKGMKWGVRKKAETIKKRLADSRAEKEAADRTYYESRYIKKGLSKKEASVAAQQRIERDRKVRKIVAVSATVALTAAVSYAAYKKIDRDFLSVNLNTDIPLKNVNVRGKGQDLNRHLYVTYKKSDSKKYRGLLANEYRKNAKLFKEDPFAAALNGISPKDIRSKVYETTLKSKTAIKAPSNRQAAKIYKEFSKNNPDTFGMSYRMFNRHLVENDNPTRDAFFKEVAKRGYNAVIDTNDQWTSGYNSRKPLILMNAGKVAAEKYTDRLSDSAINKANIKESAKVYSLIGARAGMQASAVGIAYAKQSRSERRESQRNFVDDYRKQHPNSKLSDAEILSRMDS